MKLNTTVDVNFNDLPNPGSKKAVEMGCTCPVLDNEHGEGAYTDLKGNPLFWIVTDCPIHGVDSDYNN